MNTRRIAAAVLVAFLSSTSTLPALAQGDDAVTLQARARFKEGVDYFDKGQYENARLAFLQAYALKKHPAVLLNLAQSSAKAGHPLEAARYFQQYLKEATTATPEQKQSAERGLAEVRQKLGRIEIIAPAGAEISLDDSTRLGTAPFPEPIDVEPGAHTLKSSTETVRVTAGAGQKVQAKFGASAAAPPVVAPPVSEPNAEPKTEPKDATDHTEPPNKDYGEKKSRYSRPMTTPAPFWIGLGVGVVGVAGAITFGAFKANAQSAADSVAQDIRNAAAKRGLPSQGICSSTNPQVQKDFANACNTLRDNNKKVDTDATLANVSAVVGGVGLVFALVWYLASPREPEKAAVKTPIVQPYAGWGNAGVNVAYTF